MIFFKPFIKWKKELELKSSEKWLSEFAPNDMTTSSDNKNKKIINSKGSGSNMSCVPNEEYFETNKQNSFREDVNYNANNHCLSTDNHQKENINSKSIDNDNINKRKSTLPTKSDIQNVYSFYSDNLQTKENNLLVTENFDVSSESMKSTAAITQQKFKKTPNCPFTQANFKHPKSIFSVASIDTALLLQDTEALLNDMEKRVYSRKDKNPEMSKSQCFTSIMSNNEKIPFVDEVDEKYEESNIFNLTNDEENERNCLPKPQQFVIHNNSSFLDDEDRSYIVRSPINVGNVKRNNSCKISLSESMSTSRKIDSSLNQHSSSMIGEKGLNSLHNNNNESLNDYRYKSKPKLLAMHSGIYVSRRGSSGIPISDISTMSKLETTSNFNNNFPMQRPKNALPYCSTNMLSMHRNKFNRTEYGQHSLKYNSNSTTILHNKYNNKSPPWNERSGVTDYYAYNEPCENSYALINHNNFQEHNSNLELNQNSDFNKQENPVESSQQYHNNGRNSAFSLINSLHQSSESVNNYQMTSKSTTGINEPRNCIYDILLVSSVHQYSARLCRYIEEIVHRMKRLSCEFQGNSPDDIIYEQKDSFGELQSVNRELQETLANLRSLEKQLQNVERLIFSVEKSGRNSTAGSCTEDNYLNQLEKINKELKNFVPIDCPISNSFKIPSTKLTLMGEYSYFSVQ